MKDFNLNKNVYRLTLDLLTNYTNLDMSPADYIKLNEDKLLKEQKEDYDTVLLLFMAINQHRHFLTDVTNYYYCLAKRKDLSDQNTMIVLSHIIITNLNESNKKDILNILHTEPLKKIINLLKFFNRTTIVEHLFMAACNYFEEAYVMERIILNFQNNKDLIEEFMQYFNGLLAQKKAETQRAVTKPSTPPLSTNLYYKAFPPTPANTPENKVSSPRAVPKSTYMKPKIADAIAELKEKNKTASLKLLEDSNRLSRNLTCMNNSKRDSSTSDMGCEKSQTKPETFKPVVMKKNVIVKKTASTILREASRLIKEEEEEIRKINDLLSGSHYSKYEAFLDEIRTLEEECRLQEIEKKHLQGLLTREEAILARQNQLEANKAKRAQYDLEKKETEELLKKINQQNDEKIKGIIQKTHEIQSKIEEKRKCVLNKNHKKAQELLEASRVMYEEALLKQKTELEKKIEIIKEIKALSSIKGFKGFDGNRFDPTETMNFGFLCEMSLAELQERATINKILMKEDLERRRECLRKQKSEHQQFLMSTEQFIEDCRQQKKEISNITKGKKSINKALESKEIQELKEKLIKAKQKRLVYQMK